MARDAASTPPFYKLTRRRFAIACFVTVGFGAGGGGFFCCVRVGGPPPVLQLRAL